MDIKVSLNPESADTINCGIDELPCKTLQYSINKARSGDKILIDGGGHNKTFTYQLALNELIINKSLAFASYNSKNGSNRPYIVSVYVTFTATSNVNLSFHSLRFQSDGGQAGGCLMSLNSGYGKIDFFDCSLDQFWCNFIDVTKSWKITFERCLFMNLWKPSMRIDAKTIASSASDTSVVLKECRLVESNLNVGSFFRIYGKEFIVNNSLFFKTNLNTAGSFATITNSTFTESSINQDDHSNQRQIFESEDGNGNFNLDIRNCVFSIKSPQEYPFISLRFNHMVNIKNCTFRGATNPITTNLNELSHSGVIIAYESSLIMERVIIEDNTQSDGYENLMSGDSSAMLHFINSDVHIKDSIIRNNLLLGPATTALFWKNDNSDGKITIENTYIESQHSDDSMDSVSVFLQKSPDESLLISGNSEFSCGRNSYVKLVDTDSTFAFICTKCSKGEYNMNESAIRWEEGKKRLNVYNISTCYNCPYEAICNNGVRSKGNYWGFVTSSYTIQFLPCPDSYCCSSPSTCTSYNTCSSNRKGILCGDCVEGYSHSVFNDGRCVVNDSCSHVWYFWAFYVIAVLLYGLIFLYLNEVVVLFRKLSGMIKNFITRRSRANSDPPFYRISNDVDDGEVRSESNRSVSPFHVFSEEAMSTAETSEIIYESVTASGIIKIAFFFYQVSSLIRVSTSTKHEYNFPVILDIISSFFNLKLETHSSYLDVCIHKDASIMFNEAVKSSALVIIPLALIVTTITIECYKGVVKYIATRNGISDDTEGIDAVYFISDEVPNYVKLPFHVRVKCTYLQLLLIGYLSVAVLSLKLVNCVEVSHEKRLYIQGSVECFTSWQYIVIGGIIFWIFPFCAALHSGYLLLRKCQVSPNEFLLIVTIPPAVIFYFVRSRCRKSSPSLRKSDAMLAKCLLRVINEPFRDSSHGTRLQWESILIFRRLLLVTVSVFVISPIEKVYPMGFLLMLSLIHHRFAQPFRQKFLNQLEATSLTLLCFLTLLNNFWAFTDEVQVRSSKTLMTMGGVFLYLELFIVILPVIGCVVFPVILIIKSIYKNVFAAKHD